MEPLEAISSVLTDLHYTEEEVEAVVTDLAGLLYRSTEQWTQLRQEVFSCGVAKALLGILRSSSRMSLVSKAAGCVALISHDSDEARCEFSRLDTIPLLLSLCDPRNKGERTWREEQVPVYEQALVALRKLTFHCLDNQQKLAEIGGVKLIIDLCNDKEFYKTCSRFSPESKQRLTSLTLGKKFICQAVQAPKELAGEILEVFPALSHGRLGLNTQYPAYIISLATTDQDWVADTMLASGTVWPDHASCPAHSQPVWTCVVVTCVEDGGHVWCQFCSERPHPRLQAMSDSLTQLPLPPLSHPSPLSLATGDVYAIFVDPASCPSHGCLLVPQWCRARLVAEEPSGLMLMLAVDFGFTAAVPLSHVSPLPQQCRGVPPQAIPCKLRGVAPVPSSIAILENGAAVLRNTAFEKTAYRMEIKTFGGIEALLNLSRCPDRDVAQQALGALLNLAVASELRPEMGKRGAIPVVLGLLRQYRSDQDLLAQTLGCLQNLLMTCPENATLVQGEGGEGLLVELLEGGDCDAAVRGRIIGALRNLAGPDMNGLELLSGTQRPGFSLSCRGHPHQPSSLSPDQERRRLFRQDQRFQDKCRAAGERIHANPIYRCLEPESVEEGQEVGGAFSEGESTDGEMLMAGWEEEPPPPGGEISGSVSAKCYGIGTKLPWSCDTTHEFKDIPDIYSISRQRLRRTICAMVNTCQACTIYIGVRRSGTVCGIKMNRKERDLLCVEVDNLMRSFQPSIKHDRYKVLFVPVGYEDKGRSGVLAEDRYVVQVELAACLAREVHTIAEKARAGEKAGETFERCYYRVGKTNEALSFQELRNTVAYEESGKYVEEVEGLEEGVARLRMQDRQVKAEEGVVRLRLQDRQVKAEEGVARLRLQDRQCDCFSVT